MCSMPSQNSMVIKLGRRYQFNINFKIETSISFILTMNDNSDSCTQTRIRCLKHSPIMNMNNNSPTKIRCHSTSHEHSTITITATAMIIRIIFFGSNSKTNWWGLRVKHIFYLIEFCNGRRSTKIKFRCSRIWLSSNPRFPSISGGREFRAFKLSKIYGLTLSKINHPHPLRVGTGTGRKVQNQKQK